MSLRDRVRTLHKTTELLRKLEAGMPKSRNCAIHRKKKERVVFEGTEAKNAACAQLSVVVDSPVFFGGCRLARPVVDSPVFWDFQFQTHPSGCRLTRPVVDSPFLEGTGQARAVHVRFRTEPSNLGEGLIGTIPPIPPSPRITPNTPLYTSQYP